MDQTTLYTILFFGLGLLLGSFLNVCIYRMPLRISVMSPARSFCPSCERQLTALENIPVISWAIQKGRCRGCQNSIPVRYPLVELMAGVAGSATYLEYGITVTGLIVFLIALTLIVITFIDLDHRIIPNRITFPGIAIGLAMGVTAEFTDLLRCSPYADICPLTQGLSDSVIGMLVGGGFFWAIAVAYYAATKTVGLGGGDVKLLGMTGAMLGWRSVAPTIFIGSIVGSIVGIIAMVVTGQGRKTEIPFGPWLALGAIIYLYFDLPFFKF